MSRATSEQNKAGFRWMIFFMMIIAAVCVGARGGAIKAPFTQPVELLRKGSMQTATVKGCVSIVIQVGGGTSTRRSDKTLYTTQAITANGATARGSYFFGWNGTEWCESKSVSTRPTLRSTVSQLLPDYGIHPFKSFWPFFG